MVFHAWVWVEKKKWVPFRARSLRDDQTWNRRPFIPFWISCDVEQATVLLSLETWSWFTRVWFTGIYPSKGQEASLSIIHLTRSKPSLTCKRIRQTEALRLAYNGYVNGFSRRILWLKVCKSNNYPVIQASFSSMQWKKADCNQCYCKQIVVWRPYSAFYPVKRLHIVVHFHMPISTSKIGGHIVKEASLCWS